ncbi:MAG: hypothetical protein KC466_16495 [Myxococcales bacterium]|nr:hypothetical protein [Myxococcales bacterium]
MMVVTRFVGPWILVGALFTLGPAAGLAGAVPVDVGVAVVELSDVRDEAPGRFIAGARYYLYDAIKIPVIHRVSIASDRTEGGDSSYLAALSRDGRYAAFSSGAENLVPDDANGQIDIFVHDREIRETVIVSRRPDGTPSDSLSNNPAISEDGRFVAFGTAAALVDEDTNGRPDVYVHDRDADEDGVFDEPGATALVRVSVRTDGGQQLGGAGSDVPRISREGRYVAFESDRSFGVPDFNGTVDVYVRDRDTDEDGVFDEPGAVATTRQSVDSDGVGTDLTVTLAGMSSNGRWVAFSSRGAYVPDDTNDLVDLYVHDRDPSGDGNFDESDDTRTVRVSVRSDETEATDDDAGSTASFTFNGRLVAFTSSAALVPEDTNLQQDVFLRNRDVNFDGQQDQPGDVETTRVSLSSTGAQVSALSGSPSITRDGRYVAFYSKAGDVIPTDFNGDWDAFVRDLTTGMTARVSVGYLGESEGGNSIGTDFGGDPQWIVFRSTATNLVPHDDNGAQDVFVAPNPLYPWIPALPPY